MIEGAILAGRYHLDSQIASGPQAEVWQARDARLERTVVVKILKPEAAADQQICSKFSAAAQASARLFHANVVAVYDTGRHDDIPFIVMENMEGGSLADLGRRPVGPGRAAVIAEATCAALAHAHAHGVAHGNIKLSNVLFNSRGHTKLADFGAALADEPARAADVAAAGALLYQILTGRSPVPGASGKIRAPRDFRSDIPKGLDVLVVQILNSGGGYGGQVPRDAAGVREAIAPFALAEEMTTQVASPPAAETSSFVKTEGRWLARLGLVIALVAGVTVVAINLTQEGTLSDLFGGGSPQPVSVVGSAIFDPVDSGGDGTENDDLAALAFDGDTGTVWKTQWYRTAELGRAKPGVGLVFDVGSVATLKRIDVLSVAPGWSGSTRNSDDGSTWSDPTPSTTVKSTEQFEVDGSHRWWMIWIVRLVQTPGQGATDLPYSVGIAEVRPFAG